MAPAAPLEAEHIPVLGPTQTVWLLLLHGSVERLWHVEFSYSVWSLSTFGKTYKCIVGGEGRRSDFLKETKSGKEREAQPGQASLLRALSTSPRPPLILLPPEL